MSATGDRVRTRGSVVAVAAWLAVAALFVALTVQRLWSADTWTLLSIGRWVVEHRAWPRVEEWSYTAAGRDWHELRWLCGVVMYAAWSAGGAAAVVVLQSVLVGVAFGVIVWGVRGAWDRPGVAAVVGLGLCAGASRWVMRPELVTYAMIAVFLVVLERELKKGRPEPGPRASWRSAGVWWLPVLQVVWTNSHPMFVFGPVLAWTAAASGALTWLCGEGAERGSSGAGRRRWSPWRDVEQRRMVLIACVVTGSCLVNPYGLDGALQPVRLFVESRAGHVVSRHITEMQRVIASPIATWRWDTWAAAVLLMVAVAGCAWNWRRAGWFRVMVLVQVLYLAAGAQRNLGLVAVMGTWVAAGVVLRGTGARQRTAPGLAALASVGLCVWFLAVAWFVASDRYWKRHGIAKEFGFGVVEGSIARGAADFVIGSGARGRVYNVLADGGYLIWRGIVPVYVDGRMEIRSEAFLREYFEGGGEDWKTLSARWGINTVIVPREGLEWLTGLLGADPEWALVYVDERRVVFVRGIAEHAELIARWRRDSKELAR